MITNNDKSAYGKAFTRVLLHIQENLDTSISLEQMAQLAGFSPYHFHRLFHEFLGESLMSHVRRLRLERAASWLKNSNHSISRIAFDSMYDNHESFTRAFRRAFQISPREYRIQHKENTDLPSKVGIHYLGGSIPDNIPQSLPDTESTDVTIESLDRLRVAFFRHIGPYEEVDEAWGMLMHWIKIHQFDFDFSKILSLVYDDPSITEPRFIRYDACYIVDDTVEQDGVAGFQVIEPCKVASFIHHGPHRKIDDTYRAVFFGWLPQTNYELADRPDIHFYLTRPHETEESMLQTRICVPLLPE